MKKPARSYDKTHIITVYIVAVHCSRIIAASSSWKPLVVGLRQQFDGNQINDLENIEDSITVII